MATHVKVVAILYLVFSGFCAIAAVFSSLVLGFIATWLGQSHEEGAGVGAAVLGLTGIAVMVLLLTTAALCITSGIGLLKHRRWARILGIILAALSLLRFPLGTAFGVYALWVLLKKESEPLFV